MKKQKTLILVGLAMTLSMATGCKNNSKSAPIAPGTVDPAITQDVTLTRLEIAAQLKERANQAVEGLRESNDSLKEAKNYRDNIVEARELEGNSTIKDILSAQVEASLKEVQALEKNVEMAANLLVAERKILNESVKDLSAEDQAKLGEADIEFQMDFNERKARIEISLDTARELSKSSEAKVQELNERLKISEEQFIKLESAVGEIPQQFMETERRNIRTLMKDIDDANKALAVNISNEDNLVKLFNDMTL